MSSDQPTPSGPFPMLDEYASAIFGAKPPGPGGTAIGIEYVASPRKSDGVTPDEEAPEPEIESSAAASTGLPACRSIAARAAEIGTSCSAISSATSMLRQREPGGISADRGGRGVVWSTPAVSTDLPTPRKVQPQNEPIDAIAAWCREHARARVANSPRSLRRDRSGNRPGRKHATELAIDARSALRFTLPHDRDGPTHASQRTNHTAIARDVLFELRFPIGAISFRRGRSRAAAVPMPEAAVYEDCPVACSIREIGRAREIPVAHPIPMTETRHDVTYDEFGAGVLLTNAGETRGRLGISDEGFVRVDVSARCALPCGT